MEFHMAVFRIEADFEGLAVGLAAHWTTIRGVAAERDACGGVRGDNCSVLNEIDERLAGAALILRSPLPASAQIQRRLLRRALLGLFDAPIPRMSSLRSSTAEREHQKRHQK